MVRKVCHVILIISLLTRLVLFDEVNFFLVIQQKGCIPNLLTLRALQIFNTDSEFRNTAGCAIETDFYQRFHKLSRIQTDQTRASKYERITYILRYTFIEMNCYLFIWFGFSFKS